MISFEKITPVDMNAVAADDHLVESLRSGQPAANSGPIAALLARWRDDCVTGL